MGTFKQLIEIFGDDLPSTTRSRQIYAALCNNVWRGEEDLHFTWRAAGEIVAQLRNEAGIEPADPETCQLCGKKSSEHYREKTKNDFLSSLGGEDFYWTTLLCKEGGEDTFVPGYSGSEDYIDFYCSGGEGRVAPWVEEKLLSAGWQREA